MKHIKLFEQFITESDFLNEAFKVGDQVYLTSEMGTTNSKIKWEITGMKKVKSGTFKGDIKYMLKSVVNPNVTHTVHREENSKYIHIWDKPGDGDNVKGSGKLKVGAS